MIKKDAIDFRTIAPLVLGLSKIFYKKYTFLCSESNTALDVLKHPFAEQESPVRGGGGGGGGQQSKKKNQFITSAKAMDISRLAMPGLKEEMMKDSEHLKGTIMSDKKTRE